MKIHMYVDSCITRGELDLKVSLKMNAKTIGF